MRDQSMEQNRARFDRMAAGWDANPGRIALARAVAETIRKAVPLRLDMSAMDFGAGTGLVTLALLSDVASITAVDTSAEMLRVLEEKVKALGIVNVSTVLSESDKPPLPAARFDLIVSSMVLHHLPDVPQAIRRLRPCLRPNGWIALADLESEDGTFHADPTGVYHRGFDREEIGRWLREAGFTDTTAREAHRLVRPAPTGENRTYPVFLATARAG